MDLLNISYTEESSVLANTRKMYCNFKTHTTWHRGLVLSVSDFETSRPGSIGGWALIPFFSFFPLVMQNYFIQEIWNYINGKNYTP